MSDDDHQPWIAELNRYLPTDLAHRQRLLETSARHCAFLVEANRKYNLTALTSPTDLAIKHVVDSLAALPLLSGVGTVLDLGSGPGFPGVPLAVALPETQVVLAESTQKKASFLREVVRELDLANVEVCASRGEDVLRDRTVDTVVARAVAATEKILRLLKPVRSRFRDVILYKGPTGVSEADQARHLGLRLGLQLEVAHQYTLPADSGSRVLLRITHGP